MPESILTLAERMAELGHAERERVDHLFEISTLTGQLTVPEPLLSKLVDWFAEADDTDPRQAVARASTQRVARTFNRFSGEGALFNELRARRPLRAHLHEGLDARIERARAGCDFCDPQRMTTADTWGRITGRHSVSAANASMYDAHHGMVVFREHHPHRFGRDEVQDYLDVAMQWLRHTHEVDRSLRYPFIMWNCLEKAGASQLHGHLQMLITRDRPYARQARHMTVADAYRQQTHSSYWDDWVAVHESLGLARRRGAATCVATLTPVKEKEIVIVGGLTVEEDFVNAVADTLRAMIDRLGVLSFNAGFFLPPLDGTPEYDMPAIACIVDRGDPARLTGDIGAMELYGSTVVASDPCRVIEALDT